MGWSSPKEIPAKEIMDWDVSAVSMVAEPGESKIDFLSFAIPFFFFVLVLVFLSFEAKSFVFKSFLNTGFFSKLCLEKKLLKEI